MEYNEKEMGLGIICGIAIGIVLTIIIWAVTAYITESSKVNNGYLTYRNETYRVILYDTLDTPDSKE